VVEVGRGECSRVAGVLSEASNVCAVVHLYAVLVPDLLQSHFAESYRFLCYLERRPVAQCLDNVLQRAVKRLGVVEWLIEQTICHFPAV
jgi:hypothetical protein